MIRARSVMRSSSALHSRGFGNTCVHSEKVKMVVASATNAEGEQVYPRKWNHDFRKNGRGRRS